MLHRSRTAVKLRGVLVLSQDDLARGQRRGEAVLVDQRHEKTHFPRPAPRAPPPEARICPPPLEGNVVHICRHSQASAFVTQRATPPASSSEPTARRKRSEGSFESEPRAGKPAEGATSDLQGGTNIQGFSKPNSLATREVAAVAAQRRRQTRGCQAKRLRTK